MKFGKKNEVKLDILKYNFGLIGESGIGKTTIIKQMCERLAGEDGYMFLECGKEDGADAITGINFINCPEWSADYNEYTNSMGFEDFVDDVIENRSKDWKNLRVVVIDTYDQLLDIAKPEVVRMHNRENPEKPVKSVKAAFGGFMAGEDKATEIVLDKLWTLKTVGVSFIVIGHVKQKEQEDVVTGQKFTTLTTNMSMRDFNAIKTKLHFLGVASIDREIVQEKTGKKDNKGKDVTKGVIASESRKITFRDDSYSIDSKSRFADIVSEIPFDVDLLIKALEDAIKAEQSKSGKTIEQTQKEQAKEEAEKLKSIAKAEEDNKSKKVLAEKIAIITDFIKENKSDMSLIKPVLDLSKSLGYSKPTEITDIDDADKVLELIK
jgi:GTPase SAR1 family protein